MHRWQNPNNARIARGSRLSWGFPISKKLEGLKNSGEEEKLECHSWNGVSGIVHYTDVNRDMCGSRPSSMTAILARSNGTVTGQWRHTDGGGFIGVIVSRAMW
jgi:hypothetical protein